MTATAAWLPLAAAAAWLTTRSLARWVIARRARRTMVRITATALHDCPPELRPDIETALVDLATGLGLRLTPNELTTLAGLQPNGSDR